MNKFEAVNILIKKSFFKFHEQLIMHLRTKIEGRQKRGGEKKNHIAAAIVTISMIEINGNDHLKFIRSPTKDLFPKPLIEFDIL